MNRITDVRIVIHVYTSKDRLYCVTNLINSVAGEFHITKISETQFRLRNNLVEFCIFPTVDFIRGRKCDEIIIDGGTYTPEEQEYILSTRIITNPFSIYANEQL